VFWRRDARSHGVLGIGRLRAGRESYYLSQVADGAEDYYVRGGEVPGRWVGAGTNELCLDGEVVGDDLRAVLAGVGPCGQQIARASRKTPGFDLTFRAPKSVSLLFALGDRSTSDDVAAAHDAAIDETMRYLEQWACATRRGARGSESVPGTGFVAAAFRHRTSRAGDPTLHTHVLVANATLADGSWGALDGRLLYREARAAQDVYQAALRAGLTERLGVDWQPVRHGFADIVGFTRPMIDAFSTRRQQIEAVLEQRGERSAAAAQVVALTTRDAKVREEFAELRMRWQATAAAVGLTTAALRSVAGRVDASRIGAPTATVDDLLSREGITKQRSTFDRRDVLRAWCGLLPHGAHLRTLDALVDETLGSPQIEELHPSTEAARFAASLRRRDGAHVPAPAWRDRRYTTKELADLETSLVKSAKTRQDTGVAIVETEIVEAAIQLRPSLSDEQARMIRRLATDGDGVTVVIGKAGAGKTLALDAARAAWQASGHTVIGTSLAARAAAQLEADAGIPSATLARLERELQRRPLPHDSVLIVDEAAMVGTRQLARLATIAAEAGAKLVLVGDDRQLPAIDAGGGFRALSNAIEPIQLRRNRRQCQAWEAAALDALAIGRTAAALDAYDTHGRIHRGNNAHEVREKLVTDWLEALDTGADVRILALHRDDVDDLNQRARRRLRQRGELTESIEVEGRTFAIGDQVVGLRNNYRSGILNGTTGTITALHPDEQTVTIETRDGLAIRLSRAYVRRGHLEHAYAITVHKSQGATYDQAFVLGDDRLYREAGYVALSRARTTTRLYAVRTDTNDEHDTHARPATEDRLNAALRTSRAEPSVSELSH
jgi:conjugative relaxase-like TrwC/TraI family protein